MSRIVKSPSAMAGTTRRSMTAGILSLAALGTAVLGATPAAAAPGTKHVGSITYYNATGIGACGESLNNNELVAAVPYTMFTSTNPNNDPICGRTLWVFGPGGPSSGNVVVVRIVDKCQSCGPNDIDLSTAAFQKLTSLSVGRFQGEWWEG